MRREEVEMENVRNLLAQSRMARLRALAMFPVSVLKLSIDLDKLLTAIECGGSSRVLEETVNYAEKKLIEQYQESFGCGPFDMLDLDATEPPRDDLQEYWNRLPSKERKNG